MIRFDLRLLTGLGVLGLLGCPGDDSVALDNGDDTETSTSTGMVVTTTPMTADSTTGEDVTSSGPDTTGDTTDGETGTTDTGDTTDTGSDSSSTAASDSSSGSSSGGQMCEVGQVLCDGSCIDPQTDSDHCGATDDCMGDNAGTFCEADQSCVDGACECMDQDALLCPIGCIFPATDDVYCGATDDCLGDNAGVECQFEGGEICIDGTCQCSVEDEVFCDGLCVDSQFDPNYCGASGDCMGDNAGVVCEDGQSCFEGTCQCDALNEVACDGVCIDPMTDPNYCGAINDCMGMDAGEVCSPSATCTGGGCMDTCDNCSFETGDFTGWDAADLDSPFFPLQVAGAGASVNVGVWTSFTSAPTDGSFACLSGFDGDGGTGSTNVISIGQDITLAADPPADLELDYRAAWDLANFGAPMFDRTLEVHIEPAGGGAPMQVDTILTAQAGTVTEDNGDMTGVVDLSAFAGSTVYVRIVQTVPEDFAGPGFMQIDNVRVVAQ